MVADEEFTVPVFIVRIGRGEPISVSGYRRDQVRHYPATTDATITACRLHSAGDHSQAARNRQELGSVQRQRATQAGRTPHHQTSVQQPSPPPSATPSTTPSPAAAATDHDSRRHYIGHQIAVVSGRPVPGSDQRHPEGSAPTLVHGQYASPETLFRF